MGIEQETPIEDFITDEITKEEEIDKVESPEKQICNCITEGLKDIEGLDKIDDSNDLNLKSRLILVVTKHLMNIEREEAREKECKDGNKPFEKFNRIGLFDALHECLNEYISKVIPENQELALVLSRKLNSEIIPSISQVIINLEKPEISPDN